MRLFLDTSALIAMEDKDDHNHTSAIEFRSKLVEGKTPFRSLYTSNYVLDETLTLLRMKLGHRVAVSFGETIMSSKAVKTIWVEVKADSLAWEIFKKHRDKEFSYTDCTSFALMEREAISTAFTFDKHFNQYDLRTVP